MSHFMDVADENYALHKRIDDQEKDLILLEAVIREALGEELGNRVMETALILHRSAEKPQDAAQQALALEDDGGR